MKRKVVVVFLVFALLCATLPTAFAEDYTSGDYTYTLDTDGNATITKFTGSTADLTIPDSLDGHPVVEIEGEAFAENTALTSVKLPASLQEMGAWAFKNCTSLKSVFIPKSLDYCAGAGDGPCAGCTALDTITFETGVTQIAAGLFASCPGLTEIVIPDTVTTIDECAFSSCKNLEKVTFSPSITSIGYLAFESCPLTSVELPASLQEMSFHVFKNCTSLKSVFIPKSLDRCSTVGNGPFAGCTALDTITFETGVTQIAQYLFASCTGLTEIVIPNTVTTIEYGAFRNCTNLKKVTFSPNITLIKADAFESCPLTSVELPASLQEMGSGVFKDCTSLKSVFIPKNLDSCSVVGNASFSGCTALDTITFETGVTQIAAGLFASCPGLTEIVIPETVTTIDECAFCNCENLKKVTFSPNITSIGYNAFARCLMTEVELPASLQKMGSEVFLNCTALESIRIPEMVTAIPNSAFAGCTALTSVDFGNVVTVGSSAFQNCDALTAVTVPGTVTEIGSSVFAGCDNLRDVTLGVNITEIPEKAFFECPALEKIILPFSVKKIGNNAFANCTALTEITIPRYTETISSSAFSYPGKLTIYGVAGTRADTYAAEIGAKFVAIEKNAENLSLNVTELSLEKGKTYRLIPSVTPMDFTGEVKWESADTKVATVSESGLVKAVANGTTTVTFTAGGLKASCTVTVDGHTHSYTETITAQPTCTASGTKVLRCDCGDTKTESIPALGHNFVNGVCTRCGAKEAVASFTDVPADEWYAGAVQYASQNGLMNGVGNGKFDPEGSMTRAMLVTVLWRYEGEPAEGENTFTDVPEGTWYTGAVAWAASNGIVGGIGNGKFDPDGSITREQMATILFRYAQKKGIDTGKRGELSGFADSGNVSSWAKDALQWTVAEGIINGSDGKLLPQGNATRAQVSAILMRFLENNMKK